MSENNYKISIIVPVYNVEYYIKYCLNSLINQTYKNLEIILIDDGSTDNSGKICDEYAKKDSRIIVIHQKNSGVSVARNKGLNKMTGDYVMFVDSDDWIELNACEILLDHLKTKKCDMLIYNLYKEYNRKTVKMNPYNIPHSDENLSKKLQAKILSPSIKIPDFDISQIGFACTKIVSSKILKSLRFPFENKQAIYEDVLFYYTLLENVSSVSVVNEYLYHYRILTQSATRKYNKDFEYISGKFNKMVLKFKNNHQEDYLYLQSLHIRNLFNFTTELNVLINNLNKRYSLRNRIKTIKNRIKTDYYQQAILNIKPKNLNKKLKIYYYLLKFKLYILIIIVNDCEQLIKRFHN